MCVIIAGSPDKKGPNKNSLPTPASNLPSLGFGPTNPVNSLFGTSTAPFAAQAGNPSSFSAANALSSMFPNESRSVHPHLPHIPTRPPNIALPKKSETTTGNNVHHGQNNSFNNFPSHAGSAVKPTTPVNKAHVSPSKNHSSQSSSSPDKHQSLSNRKPPSSLSSSQQSTTSSQGSSQGQTHDSKGKGSFNSWASLSKSSQSSNKAPVAKDTFAAFKKQAKDKEDKQKLLQIQQEQRRLQKEHEERERLKLERERQKEREADEALDRVRRAAMSPAEDLIGSPSPSSQGSASPAQSMSERERARKREQERRRREAQAGRIDMNRQSDIMATFEHENM